MLATIEYTEDEIALHVMAGEQFCEHHELWAEAPGEKCPACKRQRPPKKFATLGDALARAGFGRFRTG